MQGPILYKFYGHCEVEAGPMTDGGLTPYIALHSPRHELDVGHVLAYFLYEFLPLVLVLLRGHEYALDVMLVDYPTLVV